jgi:hypothetical protein
MEENIAENIPVVEIHDWNGYRQNEGGDDADANLHRVQIDLEVPEVISDGRGMHQISYDRSNDRIILHHIGPAEDDHSVYLDAPGVSLSEAIRVLIDLCGYDRELHPRICDMSLRTYRGIFYPGYAGDHLVPLEEILEMEFDPEDLRGEEIINHDDRYINSSSVLDQPLRDYQFDDFTMVMTILL